MPLACGAAGNAHAADVQFSGAYVAYVLGVSQDQTNDLREIDIRRRFKLNTRLEQDLGDDRAIGMAVEMNVDREDDRVVDDSFLYLQQPWGRLEGGETDGAGALLQVEAPSADPFLDGADPKIGAFDLSEMGAGPTVPDLLEYAQEPAGKANKLVYVTPNWDGFQAAVSYAPSVDDADLASNDAAAFDDDLGQLEDALEGAFIYQKQWDEAQLSLGAGYSHLDLEARDPVPGNMGSQDRHVWNVAATLQTGPYGLGVARYRDSRSIEGLATDIAVIGASYDLTEHTTLAGSYYDRSDGPGDLRRTALGVRHSKGDGLTYAGSVQHLDVDGTLGDGQGTQLSLGIQVRF